MKKIVLLVLSLTIAMSAWAYDFSYTYSGKTLYYNITSSTSHTVAVTYPGTSSGNPYPNNSNKPIGDLIIPTSVSRNGVTYTVTSIGEKAFYNCSGLTSVTIHGSINAIGNDAFYNCSGLSFVNFPDSASFVHWFDVSLASYYANPMANAHNIKINGVWVTNVSIPNTVTSIGNWALTGCSGLTSVTIPNTVTIIGESAFNACSGLSSITIPNSVNSIGVAAFNGCSGLSSITIGNSVTSIGNRAFLGCNNLSIVNFSDTSALANWCNVVFGVDYDHTSNPIHLAHNISINNNVIINLEVPNSVTSIGNHAFNGCSGLTLVTIPNSVTSIGDYAFHNCSGLVSITLGNSVSSFGQWAFYGCTALSTVNFSDSSALANWCSAAPTNDVYGSSPMYYAHNISLNGVPVTNLVIPDSVTTIAEYAFRGCTGLVSVVISNSVTSIGQYAFSRCTSLTSVTLSNAITAIGADAFNQCSSLTSVNFSDTAAIASWCNVTLGNSYANPISYAHNISVNNNIITNLVIPNTVTSIKKYAFNDCDGLISVHIPNSVTIIEEDAFRFCSGLTRITLGAGIISLNSDSFIACSNLDTVICLASIPPAIVNSSSYGSNSSFCGCLHTVDWLFVPCSSVNNYSSWSSFFNQTSCFSSNTVSLSVQSNNNDWGSVSGGGNYNIFSTATLHATASVDYRFVRWNDSVTSNPRTVQIISDTSFTAIFASNYCNVTATPNNTGWGEITGGGTCYYGSTITLTATPQAHCHFVRWGDGITTNPRTFTVMEDMTITAYFALDQHHVTVSTNNPNWGFVTGGGAYDYGSSVTLKAIPNSEHYFFSNWNDGNTSATRTITLVSDTSFIAYFDCDQYTVTATSADPTMGFVTGDGVYDYGSTATVTAHPNNGYQFLYWNDGNGSISRTFVVTRDREFVAYFGQEQGIDDVENGSHVCLYPNPASERVTLQLQGLTGTRNLTITDLVGREMLRQSIQKETFTFSVSSWPKGTYFLKVIDYDGTIATRKLMVR